MKSGVVGFIASLALGGLVVVGALNSSGCDDDDDTGAAGATGIGGSTGVAGGTSVAGRGGSGGGAAGTGGSTTLSYNVTLNGAMEIPMNASTATGMATVTLSPNGDVTVTGTFSGLTANASAAHIHGPAGPNDTADIIVTLTVPAATSGAVTGNGTLTVAQMAEMIAGRTYLNIHTSTYPMGEIRGQIQ